MGASIENRTYIRSAFFSMTSKEDLLALLNYAKKIVYSEKTFPIELRQFNFYIQPANSVKRYTQFAIKKKSGEDRIINAPVPGLKCIQKCLNLIFQIVFEVSLSANGFVPGRSIIDNAQKHVGSNYVYNIDLKDFFSSIDQARVWGRLKSKPFNLNNDRQIIADIISTICCTDLEVERLNSTLDWISVKKKVLPQGAPTSPVLSNIICAQLDFYLNAVANRFNLKYSRYADDITFSSMHNVYHKDSVFTNEVKRIINSQRFHIKESKTRLQKQGYRQEVTGLVVNKKINVRASYKKEIRMWLYLIESYGYEKAQMLYLSNKSNQGELQQVLTGKIQFINSIVTHKTMGKGMLSRLLNATRDKNTIEEILNVWETNGIEAAIKLIKL